ncbi:hypothetical protein KPNIH27_04840 [Klebsiella pneumoniae subsp. pneumoniae KPNIH27]|nr:hypothetical protein KPNIH27_04840 [Klebsiella pneumoniae subsp. pneumoniae KPNIH27]
MKVRILKHIEIIMRCLTIIKMEEYGIRRSVTFVELKNQLKTIILLLRITHVLIVNKGLRLTIMELGMPNI